MKQLLTFLISFMSLWLVHALNVPDPCPPEDGKAPDGLTCMQKTLGATFFSEEKILLRS